MTIEEKAKAYDRVAKEVKDFFEGRQKMYSDVSQTLEYLFPDLKESEDEKIRKAIIEYLRQRLDRSPSIPAAIGSWIAWLEKQGGQKTTDNKEKLDVLNFIRKETCCGLAEANNALSELIKVLKEHPFPIMDKPRKLKIEWRNNNESVH